jgi:threonine synthase
MWKAFEEMRELGWSDRASKLDCIQPTGCAPVVKAWREGRGDVVAWERPQSIAIGLQAPKPAGGSLMLRILAASGSHAETVTDDELLRAQLLLAQSEGLYVEPSAAASAAGLRKMRDGGVIGSQETVVCMLTGTGLKAPDVTAALLEKPRVLDPDTSSL